MALRNSIFLAILLGCGSLAAQTSRQADPADAARRAEYAARASKIAASDLDGRCALARWCKDQTLYSEMRREAGRILKRDPDHAGTRELLGQQRVDGQWMSRADAMRARGYVRYRGQWMRKYDVVRLKHAEKQKRVQRKQQRDLNRHFRRLVSSSAKARDTALHALEDLADRREWAELRDTARRYHAIATRYWIERPVVLVTIRAQHSELLGLEPFTTSLGTGLPVTLQLPRMRTISIGTTVGIPAGRGR